MFSKLALGAIWGYQQYISPHKGFRCAYSVHHGGTGCSGYAKFAIRDHGLWRAWPKIRQRFRDCKTASLALRDQCPVHGMRAHSEPLDEDERAELERRRKNDKCDTLNCCAAVSLEPIACCSFSSCVGASSAQTTNEDTGPSANCGDGFDVADCSAPSCGGGGADACGGCDGCGGCDCSPSCS